MVSLSRAGLLLLIMVCLPACSLFMKTPVSLAFAGDIAVRDVKKQGENYQLMVEIQGGSWLKAPPGKGFEDIRVKTRGQSIFLTCRLASHDAPVFPGLQTVDLGKLEAGTWYVQYLNPDGVITNIDTITVQ